MICFLVRFPTVPAPHYPVTASTNRTRSPRLPGSSVQVDQHQICHHQQRSIQQLNNLFHPKRRIFHKDRSSQNFVFFIKSGCPQIVDVQMGDDKSIPATASKQRYAQYFADPPQKFGLCPESDVETGSNPPLFPVAPAAFRFEDLDSPASSAVSRSLLKLCKITRFRAGSNCPLPRLSRLLNFPPSLPLEQTEVSQHFKSISHNRDSTKGIVRTTDKQPASLYYPSQKQHSRKHLDEWFASRQIQFLAGNVKAPDYHLATASLFIGNFYPHLQPLLKIVRRSISQKRYRFRLTLNSVPDKSYSSRLIQHLLRYLHHTSKILHSYQKIGRHAFRIHIKQTVEAYRFFGGEWLELFTHATVLQLLSKFPNVPFVYARNLRVRFESLNNQSPQQCEIDFFLLFGNYPICFEAKSGSIRNLTHYQQFCQQLQISPSHSFLIIPSPSPTAPRIQHLSNRYAVTCCSTTSFARKLHNVLSEIHHRTPSPNHG